MSYCAHCGAPTSSGDRDCRYCGFGLSNHAAAQGPSRVGAGALGNEIERLLAAGNKIEAIKRYREQYGVGLREAKDAIDAWEARRG